MNGGRLEGIIIPSRVPVINRKPGERAPKLAKRKENQQGKAESDQSHAESCIPAFGRVAAAVWESDFAVVFDDAQDALRDGFSLVAPVVAMPDDLVEALIDREEAGRNGVRQGVAARYGGESDLLVPSNPSVCHAFSCL